MQQYKSYIKHVLQDPMFKYIDNIEKNHIPCKDCFFELDDVIKVLNSDDSFSSNKTCESCKG